MTNANKATVLILGGAGFIGGYLTNTLSKSGYQVRIPTRNRERAKAHLIVLPNVEVIQTDISNMETFDSLFEGIDIVINCVGILHENQKNDFKKFHTTLVDRVVAGCNSQKVKHLIHLSALKASSSGPSAYLRSKADGESIIQSKLNSTTDKNIIRPSVVFGPGDSFLTMFAELANWLPLIPLAKPNAKFQPVFVGDLVQSILSCVDGIEKRTVIDLCGPKQYELIELVRYATSFSRFNPIIIPLPEWASYAQARVFELIRLKLISTDNLSSMSVDNTCDTPSDGSRKTIESIAPSYLSRAS
ncbi:MAG: complex I NDUFA9 subunit family protein [Burkholderiales bacterium]|nr:complex I NDUFA9 subunit family protein [Burkholderiales bacterium]